MQDDEAKYLLELREKHICPFCGKTIPDEKLVGSGQKAKGGFCSLSCYTQYHKEDILKRARNVQALAERHRNS